MQSNCTAMARKTVSVFFCNHSCLTLLGRLQGCCSSRDVQHCANRCCLLSGVKVSRVIVSVLADICTKTRRRWPTSGNSDCIPCPPLTTCFPDGRPLRSGGCSGPITVLMVAVTKIFADLLERTGSLAADENRGSRFTYKKWKLMKSSKHTLICEHAYARDLIMAHFPTSRKEIHDLTIYQVSDRNKIYRRSTLTSQICSDERRLV